MTCFDCLQIMAALAGVLLVGAPAYARYGMIGGLAGAFLGGFVGLLVGGLPFAIAMRWTWWSLARQSTQRLRERLASEYFSSHLILAELARRGEDIRVDLPVILALLRSESADERRFGFGTLRFWFPEVADQIADFNPADATESCRDRVARLEGAD